MQSFKLILPLILILAAFSPSADADLVFVANLDSSQVIAGGGSSVTATATALFVLDDAMENLSYSVQFNGLNLEENPANRTGVNDIDKIHLHNSEPGSTGPHVLNIFGIPSEDDAELVVDYDNNSFSGVYNDVDSIDPDTGLRYDQTNPLFTKLLSNFADDIIDGQVYIAVHTIGEGGEVAIRGQLVSAIPEPSGVIVVGLLSVTFLRRRR